MLDAFVFISSELTLKLLLFYLMYIWMCFITQSHIRATYQCVEKGHSSGLSLARQRYRLPYEKIGKILYEICRDYPPNLKDLKVWGY